MNEQFLSADIRKKLREFELQVQFTCPACRGRASDASAGSGTSCLGILGPSGCGKSMTLKSIAGIVEPDSGSIILDGRELFNSSRKVNLKPQKRRVGYLFQNYALFPNMTVEENILTGLKAGKRYGEAQQKQRVLEMIERFRLSGLEKRYPAQLSGGQQQRVALARILAYDPEALLLDEPFSAMDTEIPLTEKDLVFVTNGSCTEGTIYGDQNHAPDGDAEKRVSGCCPVIEISAAPLSACSLSAKSAQGRPSSRRFWSPCTGSAAPWDSANIFKLYTPGLE